MEVGKVKEEQTQSASGDAVIPRSVLKRHTDNILKAIRCIVAKDSLDKNDLQAVTALMDVYDTLSFCMGSKGL